MTAFAQNTRDEVRVQGDGTISGALAAQPGMKQQTYVAECLTPWDSQARRVYSEDGIFPTLQARERAGANSQAVLTDRTTATPVAVDYGGCLAPWDVQSKRVFTENGCAPTLQAGTHESQNIQPIVMASAHTNAEIGEGGVAPTLIAHIAKDAPVLATETTCSQASAQQTETSSSSTIRASTEDDCSSSQGSGPSDSDVVVIDRAAYNQGENASYPPHIEQTDVMDTLVARGPHAVSYSQPTARGR